MKNKLLELLAKDQNRLKNMLGKCPPVLDTTHDDLLQDFYIFVFTKEYRLLTTEHMFPNGKMNQGLVFVILKNFILGELKKNTSKMLRKNDAYSYWKSERLESENEKLINLASESNLLILDELKKDLTEEEYETLIDIIEKRFIFKFRDEEGNTDKVAYQAAMYKITKKYNELKEKSSLFKYVTPEEVDDFEEFSTLKLKINK